VFFVPIRARPFGIGPGLLAVLSFLGLFLVSWPCWAADAPEKSACVEAHASGQELRLAGQWVLAARLFQTCASTVCPTAVTADCKVWYDEIHQLTPSIVIAALTAEGVDTVDATLSIDGKVVAERIPSVAVDLDPGEHMVRVQHARWRAVERHIVLREGEKDRRVVLRFSAPPRATSSSTPALGVLAIAGGSVALVTGLTFGVLGKTREDELADSPCGRTGTCAHHDVDVVRERYWIGGIGAGIGIAAIALGVWSVLTQHRPDQVGLRGRGRL
jgi:hypothetical protein